MERVYNFGAGPACLPTEVLEQIRDDIPNWYEGMSVMELSHRSAPVLKMVEEIEADVRKLLSVPDDFAVLFMQGGARGQFASVPMNLLRGLPSADYLVTGTWSQLALEEAKKYCNPHCVATGEAQHFTRIPDEKSWTVNDNAPYFHYTDNETIHGVEFASLPNVKPLLVSDMTSNIVTKPIDFSRIGLIYASAQKNLGIAGITLIIMRKELLGHAVAFTPSILNYDVFYQSKSLHNTSPVFCWYVLGLMVKWCLAQGGIHALAKACEQKSQVIYELIDNSSFYTNPVFPEHRSRINIPFRLPNEDLEAQFIQAASQQNLMQLKGHIYLGGCRASLYNAMPLEGVQALAKFMRSFEKEHA
jgi:phosphoserine aminotransferase